jgi:hypothetical protein
LVPGELATVRVVLDAQNQALNLAIREHRLSEARDILTNARFMLNERHITMGPVVQAVIEDDLAMLRLLLQHLTIAPRQSTSTTTALHIALHVVARSFNYVDTNFAVLEPLRIQMAKHLLACGARFTVNLERGMPGTLVLSDSVRLYNGWYQDQVRILCAVSKWFVRQNPACRLGLLPREMLRQIRKHLFQWLESQRIRNQLLNVAMVNQLRDDMSHYVIERATRLQREVERMEALEKGLPDPDGTLAEGIVIASSSPEPAQKRFRVVLE